MRSSSLVTGAVSKGPSYPASLNAPSTAALADVEHGLDLRRRWGRHTHIGRIARATRHVRMSRVDRSVTLIW